MATIREQLASAAKHHQAGRLGEAEYGYQRILRRDPGHGDTLHLLGLLAHQKGRNDQAVEHLHRARAIAPRSPAVLCSLGTVYQAMGRVEDAVGAFQDAIRIAPSHMAAHFNLGNALRLLERLDEAEAAYRWAIDVKPDFAEAYNNLGVLYTMRGRHAESADHYRRAIELNPRFAEGHCNLGRAMFEEEDYTAAAEHLQTAIRVKSDYPLAHFRLGNAYYKQQRLQEAVASYRNALRLDPHHGEAHSNLGNALRELEQYAEAEASYRRALDYLPGLAATHINLAAALKDQEKYDEAIAHYHRAVELDPDFAEVHQQLAHTLKEACRFDEAEAAYREAQRCRSNYPEAHADRGLILLSQGKFEEGWPEYEWRLQTKDAQIRFTEPIWQGESLRGKRVLVYAEQGIGDEIMFGSCLPRIAAEAAECVVECDRRMMALFRRSFPQVRVIAKGPKPTGPDDRRTLGMDVQIAIGSLPCYLGWRLDTPGNEGGYLVPDAEAGRKWRSRLAELEPGLKIGISWRGGLAAAGRRRSTRLGQWAELFGVEGTQFINLQYGDCKAELAEASRDLGATIHDWDDANPLRDLDDFAAEIAALDLVISADNSTVHMAGALGIPTWTLVPLPPDWRWMLDRDDAPWYPSLRLFRQTQRGHWAPVFRRVADELRRYVDEHKLKGDCPNFHGANGFPQEESPTAAKRGSSPSAASLESLVTVCGPAVVDVLHEPIACAGTIPATAEPATGPPAAETAAQSPTPEKEPTSTEADREREKYERAWAYEQYRKFSPGLHAAEKMRLVEMLRGCGVKTILDAGCGSGKLMRKLLVEHAEEFTVHGFDISPNCLDPFFDPIKDQVLTVGCLWNPHDFRQPHDAILCTDVLEHIPTKHVPAVLANFHRCSRKLCYLAVALFDDAFGPKLFGEPLHVTVKEPFWWLNAVAAAGFRLRSCVVERNTHGQQMWLHAFLMP